MSKQNIVRKYSQKTAPIEPLKLLGKDINSENFDAISFSTNATNAKYSQKYNSITLQNDKNQEISRLSQTLEQKRNYYNKLIADYKILYENYNNSYNDLYKAKSELELVRNNNNNLKLLILDFMNIKNNT